MLHSYPWYFLSWRGSRTRARMTIEQRGLFREVLDLLYEDGGVPDNQEDLRRIVGATEDEWARSWPSVRATLIVTDAGMLTHPMVRDKLADLQRMQGTRRRAASTAAKARWTKVLDSAGIASGMRDASVTHALTCGSSASASASASTSERHSADADVEFALDHPAERQPSNVWKQEAFNRFWDRIWSKIGKADAEKAFRRVATDRATAERIIAAAGRQGARLLAEAERQARSVIHPATWLRQGRFDDEPTEPNAAGVRDPGDLPDMRPVWMEE